MNAEAFTKVCILFRPDDETLRVIESIVLELLGSGADVVKKDGDLPYHMTIIGGGKVAESGADKTLKGIVQQIKPFSERVIPQVIDVEPAQLFGDCLGIRLKLKGYVITGDTVKNNELRAQLSPRFRFDGPRHITLLTVVGENKYQDMDEKLEKLETLLLRFREQFLRMSLLPEVWVRSQGSNLWRHWPHN
jgi:hypothetical protein